MVLGEWTFVSTSVSCPIDDRNVSMDISLLHMDDQFKSLIGENVIESLKSYISGRNAASVNTSHDLIGCGWGAKFLSTSASSIDILKDPHPLDECISLSQLCNGLNDCGNGFDESPILCDCEEKEMLCNGSCLPVQLVKCNGLEDCVEGADERFCESYICPPFHFRCDSHICILNERVCDFHPDCGPDDSSDERICSYRSCWYGEYACANRQCINKYLVCDGNADCLDASDERNCSAEDFVDCANGERVHRSLWCDSWPDCPDNHADEINCGTCDESKEFRCRNGRCIPLAHECDSVCDCVPDCEDEDSVMATPLSVPRQPLKCTEKYRVLDGLRICLPETTVQCSHSSRCIGSHFLCDGTDDCFPFGTSSPDSDELGCELRQLLKEATTSSSSSSLFPSQETVDGNENICDKLQLLRKETRENESRTNVLQSLPIDAETTAPNVNVNVEALFLCRSPLDGRCLPALSTRCNGRRECVGGDDELDCPITEAEDSCLHFLGRASSQYFECASGKQCIPLEARCDSRIDCRDATDEISCATVECATGWARCRSGQCIPEGRICDWRQDCFDGSDELNCEYDMTCQRDLSNSSLVGERFRCSSGQCVSRSVRCLGGRRDEESERKGCADGSHLLGCGSFACPAQENLFKCQSGYCISSDLICDGLLDCRGGFPSDEHSCAFSCDEELVCECLDVLINCSSRALHRVPKGIEKEMMKIILSGNSLGPRLASGSLSSLRNFSLIDLSSNEISTMEAEVFAFHYHLTSLNLANNRIKVIKERMFYGLVNLKSLDLRGNGIELIYSHAFEGLSSLNSLDLSGQRISLLSAGAFSSMTMLQTLDLSHNEIGAIQEGLFGGASHLVSLDISRNPIVTVERHSFRKLRKLKFLTSDEHYFCCLVVTTLSHCVPPQDEFSSCSDLMSHVVLRVFIWILSIVSIGFNLIVLILRRAAAASYDRQHSRLILHLALGDLLMGVYLAMIGVADSLLRGEYFLHEAAWRSSSACSAAGFLSTLSSQLSVFLLLVITVDRWLKIKWPLRFQGGWTPRTARNTLLAVWVSAIVIAAAPLIPSVDRALFQGKFYGRSGVCLALQLTPDRPPGWQYSVGVFMGLNSVAMITIAVLYVWMFLSARASRKALHHVTRVEASRADPEETCCPTGEGTSEKKKETIVSVSSDHQSRSMAIRITLIVLSNVACWLPIVLIGCLSLAGVAIDSEIYAWVAVFVLPLNSALNPVIYTLSVVSLLTRWRSAHGSRRERDRFQNANRQSSHRTLTTTVTTYVPNTTHPQKYTARKSVHYHADNGTGSIRERKDLYVDETEVRNLVRSFRSSQDGRQADESEVIELISLGINRNEVTSRQLPSTMEASANEPLALLDPC